MKTIEEKAKAYDEIIERANTMLAAGEVMYGKENNARQLITDLIPELAESEDERIRKEIRDFILYEKEHTPETTPSGKWDKWLSYLERQKVHVPENEESGTRKEGKHIGISPIFKVGDIIERKDGLGTHLIINCISGNFYGCRKLVYPEWDTPFCEIPFKNQDMFQLSRDFEQKPAWSEEDEKMRNLALDWAETLAGQYRFVGINPTDFRKIISWLESLRPQSKQEWSEGDKEKLYQVIETLLANKEIALREYPLCKPLHKAYDDMITFLKSLRPSWKPSEEQMRGLKYFLDYHRPQRNAGTTAWKEFDSVDSLYNDLLKLKSL